MTLHEQVGQLCVAGVRSTSPTRDRVDAATPTPEHRGLLSCHSWLAGDPVAPHPEADVAGHEQHRDRRPALHQRVDVKTHVGSNLRKLDLRDRVQIVMVAYEYGMHG